MKEFKFKNLSEFLEITSSLPYTFGCHSSDLWYRGIKDVEMRLVPGVIWKGVGESIEESMISEFMTYFRNYHGRNGGNAFELYALMQHYGLPTRLLDWSFSPLVSLYFALEQPNDKDAQRAVWAMVPHGLNEKTIDFAGVVAPNEFKQSSINNYLPKYLRNSNVPIPTGAVAISLPFSHQRVTSQKGAFTIHGHGTQPVDELFAKHGLDKIACLTLESEDYRMPLLEQLYSIGVKEDDIYQDLNSLSKRVMREFGI